VTQGVFTPLPRPPCVITGPKLDNPVVIIEKDPNVGDPDAGVVEA